MDTLAVFNPMIKHTQDVWNLERVNAHPQHAIAGNIYFTGFRNHNTARLRFFEASCFLRNRYNLCVHLFLLTSVTAGAPIDTYVAENFCASPPSNPKTIPLNPAKEFIKAFEISGRLC